MRYFKISFYPFIIFFLFFTNHMLFAQSLSSNASKNIEPSGIEISLATSSPIYDILSFLGRIVPEHFEKHMSGISGYVQKVYASPGQVVKKGDLLFTVLTDKELGQGMHRPQQVYSRLTGIILSSDITEGAYVKAFNEGIEVANQDKWVIRTYASDKDLSYLKLGQDVSFFLDNNRKGMGTVSEISALMDSITQLFPVSFALPPSPSFYLGALVKSEIKILKGNSLLVPRASIMRRFNRAYIWKVVEFSEEGNYFEMVPVVLGDLYNNYQIILGGLQEGDLYAINANNRLLRENTPLKTQIVEEVEFL